MRLILSFVAAAALTGAVVVAAAGSYSAKPLNEPIRDVATNSVEFAQFNNWLNENYASQPEEKRQALKEHLYSIIDSAVRQLYKNTGKTFGSAADPLVTLGFTWATRMRVIGADLVLRRLDPEAAKRLGPLPPEDSFKLSLDGDSFVLGSTLGPWRATFPYYFMIGDTRNFEATNGLRTQLAMISTGFGRHTGGDGYSQATIMLVYSPKGEKADFRDFWLGQFGVSAEEKAAESVQGLPSYRHFDPASKLHTEIVFPAIGKGAIAVSYMGLDGTYQWNRPHFEDFIAALSSTAKN